MEHLNKVVKTLWKSLGANISELSAQRIANTVQPVELIMEGIDRDCGGSDKVGFRTQGKPEVAIAHVTKDLMHI